MNAVGGTVRKLSQAAGRAATMTTEAAGALGGAAVNGVVGGVTGAAAGVQRGLGKGSHSTPAAALTMGALGLAGLVEWPVLVAVGGTALVLRQLNQRKSAAKPPVKPAKVTPATPIKSAKSAKSAPPVKSAKPAKRAAPTKSAKPAAARRSPAKARKSTPTRPSRGSQSRGRR